MLSHTWKYKKNQLRINIEQVQPYQPFKFPLEVRIELRNGSFIDQHLSISQKEETFTIPAALKVKNVILDPDCWLLFDEL